jgi:hypothetical protein
MLNKISRAAIILNTLGLAFFSPREMSAKVLSCDYHNVRAKTAPIELIDIGMNSVQSVLSNDAMIASFSETLTGDAVIVNTSDKPIQWYLIVVEFGMQSSRPLSIPIFNVALALHGPPVSPLDFPYMSWVYAHGKPWGDRLEPGKKTRVSFLSPELISTCPRDVKITDITLKYVDGSTSHYHLATLNLAPELISAPLKDLQALEMRVRTAISGTLYLDANGRATMFKNLSSRDEAGISQFLMDLMKDWVFSPNISAGQRTDGHVDFLLSIGDLSPRWTELRTEALSKTGTAIPFHIVPPSGTAPELRKSWRVAVGGRLVPATPN